MKSIMIRIVMSVFAVLIMLAVFASANGGLNREAGIDQDLQELIDNVPAPDQQTLDKCKADPGVLMVSGKMPELKAGKDSYDWFVSLRNVREKVTRNGILKEYMYPQGPVVGYGVRAEHYFTVALYNENDESGTDAETVDEIISVLTAVAAESGISEMPIVIEKGKPVRFDEGTYTTTEEEKQILRQENPDLYKDVKGTPVVFTTSDGSEIVMDIIGFAGLFRPFDEKTLMESGVTKSSGYDSQYRPIVGGITHSIAVNQNNFSAGTIGFVARNTTTNQTGYVTAGHLAFWQTGFSSYQPNITTTPAVGSVSILGTNTDAAFVSYSNVTGKIHIGNGALVKVNGTYDGGMPGMTLSRSGKTTGNTSGIYVGSFTNVTFDGHLLENIEAMTGTCSAGDSGGPVYYKSGSKYKIVGITSMSGTAGNQIVTIYIPYSEISSKLGIEALNG